MCNGHDTYIINSSCNFAVGDGHVVYTIIIVLSLTTGIILEITLVVA